MFNVLSPLVLFSEVLQVAVFCYPTTNKFNELKTLFRINIRHVLVEDIFWIIFYFQLFQSLLNFFNLGALWEDSIFGQFLIETVGPCFNYVIWISILCGNHCADSVPVQKKGVNKITKSVIHRIEDDMQSEIWNKLTYSAALKGNALSSSVISLNFPPRLGM